MRAENFDIQVIIEGLQGTMDSIQQQLDFYYPEMTEDDLTEDDHSKLDQEIFLCANCGWWCEISEESGIDESELVCNDCAEENEEED